ncbi:MAG TPA: hypothetical protein VI423_02175 [Paenisporosarcina sp.]|nr:hypothetical protein [Paenisporosarcina sp.]
MSVNELLNNLDVERYAVILCACLGSDGFAIPTEPLNGTGIVGAQRRAPLKARRDSWERPAFGAEAE